MAGNRNASQGAVAIFNGVKYDALGEVVADWLFAEHPGEVSSFARTAN